MAFDGLLITEIFHSIQGETTHAGLPYVFVRLTGCNLRCTYCDTTYAFKGGEKRSIDSVISEVKAFNCAHVLITGGEPLLQRGTLPLIHKLRENHCEVSIETHGEIPISAFSPYARIVLDIKTPGSGMQRGGFRENLKHLKKNDEIKFVITSREDYEWSKELLREYRLNELCTVLFSPVLHNHASPAPMEGLSPEWLAERILKDGLPVRMQFQLHKLIWGSERRGV
jgi:7-carboxy-7-deazaguanine synthase